MGCSSPARVARRNVPALLCLTAAMVVAAAAQAAPDGDPPGTGWSADQNLLGYVEQSDQLSRLLALLKLAGLTSMLRQPDPLTLLAPTDAAFATMPPAMLQDLQLPVNKGRLLRILQCHLIPGAVRIDTRAEAMAGNPPIHLVSVTGCRLTVRTGPHGLQIEDANGIKAGLIHSDVGEANGLVQVIAGVLTPAIDPSAR